MYFGFQVTRMTEWGQKSNPPAKSLGPPTKPQKYHAEFLSLKNLQRGKPQKILAKFSYPKNSSIIPVTC